MKKLTEIDYTPLDAMNEGWRALVRLGYVRFGVAFLFGFVLVFINSSHSTFIFFGLMGLSIISVYLASRIQLRRDAAWRKFAEANEWFVIPIDRNDPRYIPPSLVRFSYRPMMSLVVHASFEGHECDVFLYEFQTGSGKQKKMHYYTVARVALDRPFPHLILDSKHARTLMNRGDATEPIKLEGNFSDHFTLYHTPGDHINALSIITPDVMQALLKFGKIHDVEIMDNQLFFISGQDHRGPEALPGVLAAVDAVADEIKHKAKTIRMPKDHVPHVTTLASAIKQYGQSKNNVMNNLLGLLLFVLMIPFILFLFVGIMGSFDNLLK